MRITLDNRQTYGLEAILLLSAFIDAHSMDNMSFDRKQVILAHLEAVLQNESKYSILNSSLENARLLQAASSFGDFFKSHGRYSASEEMWERVLKGRTKMLGLEHPHTLQSMNNLALLLDNRGKYDEAEPMYRQTLQLREQVLGLEHPDTLQSMNNLALLLKKRGKYDGPS
jgi:tetratricopeptide (TPR) repeat protein